MNWKLLLALVAAICIALLIYRGCYSGNSKEVTIPETAETQEVQGMMNDIVLQQQEAGGP